MRRQLRRPAVAAQVTVHRVFTLHRCVGRVLFCIVLAPFFWVREPFSAYRCAAVDALIRCLGGACANASRAASERGLLCALLWFAPL